jgi:hypothetical protein
MRIAARVVTEFATPAGVSAVVSNGSRVTIMVRQGSNLIMADSVVRQWRTYALRSPSTPASTFSGEGGVPTALRSAPLTRTPPDVISLGQETGCDVVALYTEFLQLRAQPVARRTVDDWDW